jgi:hypothetical protein
MWSTRRTDTPARYTWTCEKAQKVAEKLVAMKLGRAAAIVRYCVEETSSYMAFAREHWTRIRTNNMLEPWTLNHASGDLYWRSCAIARPGIATDAQNKEGTPADQRPLLGIVGRLEQNRVV